MKRILLFLFSLLILLPLLSICKGGKMGGDTITLLYTANIRGETGPCG